MPVFGLLSTLVCLAAAFSLINHHFLRLPRTVGVMLLSLASSIVVAVVGRVVPGLHAQAAALVSHIDFSAVVLHGMLAFLLFAGALQLDMQSLRRQKAPVISLALLGTGLSALIVAGLLKGVLDITGLHAGWVLCLLFGALISPTDPIAVLEMLRRVGAPASLEAQLTGESLFNDGVGAVLFLTLLSSFGGGKSPGVGGFLMRLLVESGGGFALGIALGWVAYRLLRTVDSYRVEEIVTLALAMGSYALADTLHLSAPLAVVGAGLVASGWARTKAMSEATRERVDQFWDLIDDLMNVILFLMIGLEMLVMPWNTRYIYAGLLAIPVSLISRFVSVESALGVVRPWHKPVRGSIPVLTWGGLRGGLAVALALAAGPGQPHDRIVAITYIVVIFALSVQGLTMSPLLRKLGFASSARAETRA